MYNIDLVMMHMRWIANLLQNMWTKPGLEPGFLTCRMFMHNWGDFPNNVVIKELPVSIGLMTKVLFVGTSCVIINCINIDFTSEFPSNKWDSHAVSMVGQGAFVCVGKGVRMRYYI